jgi:hypothetical protein
MRKRAIVVLALVVGSLSLAAPAAEAKTRCFTNAGWVPSWKQGPITIVKLHTQWRYCWNRRRGRVVRFNYLQVKPIITDGGEALGWDYEGVQEDLPGYWYKYRGRGHGGYADRVEVRFCQKVCWFADIRITVRLYVHYNGPNHDKIYFDS